MNELIKVSARAIGQDEVQTINARELHAFLEVGKDFSNWVKDRIEQYDFVEDQDFVVFPRTGENSGVCSPNLASNVCSPILGNKGRGGHNRKEYHLTLDMAKELAMVERNEKGKQARQYFIECERRAKSSDPMVVLNDPSAMRGLLLTYSERVLTLEAANAELKPKAEALDRITDADGALCVTNAAKTLQLRPKDLFCWMSQNRWVYKRPGSASWLGYQDRVQQGFLSHKVTTVSRSDGSEKVVEQVLVTPKGLARLAELMAA